MSEKAYNENDATYLKKTEMLLDNFPPFVRGYLYEIENNILPKTRYMYLYDLKLFFEFLVDNNPDLKDMNEISLDYLNKLDYNDFTEYTHHMMSIVSDHTRARRLSSLQRFWKYLYTRKLVTANQDFLTISRPKLRKGNVVYLEKDEMNALINNVENAVTLTDEQKKRVKKQSVRDLAIISLIMGTGIRVSECVSLDIKDVNLKDNSVHVFRKGRKEMSVYYTDEVCTNLSLYMEERSQLEVIPADKDALFISRNHRRITARAVENLVKKYASEEIVGTKNITAHKLRSSYGTSFYRQTGDLYLTATVLGHSSMQTTKDYYAAQSEEALKKAGDVKTW